MKLRNILAVATLLTMAIPAVSNAAEPWQYRTSFPDKADRQCAALKTQSPGKAGNWPQCRTAARPSTQSLAARMAFLAIPGLPGATIARVSARPLAITCHAVWDGPGTTCTITAPFEKVGFLGSWSVNFEITQKTVFAGNGPQTTLEVKCRPGGGWGTSINVDDCGVLGVSASGSKSVGAFWRVTNDGIGPAPSITTCWYAYRWIPKHSDRNNEPDDQIIMGSC